MIGTLSNYLNFGSYQDQIGAAFIIDHMLGQGSFAGRGAAAAGVGYARSNFGTWQNLVNTYASSPNPGSFGVQWNVWRNGVNPNSAFFFDINDDALHQYIPGVDDGPVIRFYWPGGEFLIQRVCGNLLGSLSPPPSNRPPSGSISVSCNFATGQQTATYSFSDPDGTTWGFIGTGAWNNWPPNPTGTYTVAIPQSATNPYVAQVVNLAVYDSGPLGDGLYHTVASANTQTPCVTFACGAMTTTPTLIDPTMNFSVTVNVTNNVSQTPPGATMNLRITPPAGAIYSYNNTQPAGGGGSVSTNTFSGLGPTNASGVYNVTWTLNAPSVSKTCTSTFPVVYLPYLNVYGGDVTTGASADYSTATGASTCNTTNAASGVFSWNNHTTNFSGGGAQYAVQALAQIEDFASAQSSSSPAPTGLSFANIYTPPDASKLNAAQGLFGGYFGATTGDCDFTSDIVTAPTTSDTVIGTTTVPLGTRVVQYIKGADVFINGSGIKYAGSGGWISPSQIPYFKLVVVGGNIYVGSGVAQLDGLYVSEPDGGRGGTIYTCASGLRAPANPALAGFYTTCNSQLAINGSFVAKQVQFLRSYGSLGQARATDSVTSNHSAEVFNYTPELWLPRGGNTPNSGYTAITGLPPIL
jgi:hypothetical protein